MAGTLNLPPVAVVDRNTTVTWHNMEPAEYPVFKSIHDIAPDKQVADAGGFKVFPFATKIISPGGTYKCIGISTGIQCRNKANVAYNLGVGTYAYKCSVHPDQQRGLLIIQ